MARLIAFLCALVLSLVGSAALAQPEFPELGGNPVVDAASIIDPADETLLNERLLAFEQRTQRQFAVVTVPSLDGYEISDYGYQLGRHWGLGDAENDDGIILLVAPNERKVRIEVGYGLEAVIPDGLAFDVIERDILPRFREDDMTGGIIAGTERIMQHLELPPEEQQAAIDQAEAQRERGGGFPVGAIFWVVMIVVFALVASRGRRGRRYRRGGMAGAVGDVLLWTAINAAMNSGRGGGGSSWGGGGGFGGGGGGGFSGGGGSFGGGGASGSW